MNKRWLEAWPWDTIVAINAGVCKAKIGRWKSFAPPPKADILET
jgi:hypothetical protein